MKPLSYEEYQQKVQNLKSLKDISNFVKELIVPTLQTRLEAELTEHLGYEKYGRKDSNANPNNSSNARNGCYPKTIKSSYGEAEIKVPRASAWTARANLNLWQ